MFFVYKFCCICLFHFCFIISGFQFSAFAQNDSSVFDKLKKEGRYLPDFSFAGYHNGEKELPGIEGTVVFAKDYGVMANDGIDDSKALIKAMEESYKIEGHVVLMLPPGRIILSEILYIERSNFVLRGAGTGMKGTEIYFPRPLMYVEDPEQLRELREYLIEFKKRQKEPENNIDLPFSQYAWSGGFIWTKVPDVRVKSYLQNYEKPYEVLANVVNGKRGEFELTVKNIKDLSVGDVVELQWFNKDGENADIIDEIYQNAEIRIGSHHWNFPDLPLVKQQVEITKVSKNSITIKSPLTIDVQSKYNAQLVKWEHLREVGIEHLKMSFPNYPRVAHHVEPGFNAIYLTRVFNGWVNNVVIENADSGVLTEEIANVTIKNVTTKGDNMAHYTVAMSGTYNVLAEGIKVYNRAVHPLSFNTFSTKSVYLDCEVFVDPILDQHSGANHQNLFDNITVHLSPLQDSSYPLFVGGGAPYWKPSHGAFSTFWNIEVNLTSALDSKKSILLNGMEDGPFARVIGVHGNHHFEVDYGPDAFIDRTNESLRSITSLYEYQLERRLDKEQNN